MKPRKLTLEILCGEKTCAYAKGKFCPYLGSKRFGTVSLCLLFPPKDPMPHQDGAATELETKDGWLQRCDACLAAERES